MRQYVLQPEGFPLRAYRQQAREVWHFYRGPEKKNAKRDERQDARSQGKKEERRQQPSADFADDADEDEGLTPNLRHLRNLRTICFSVFLGCLTLALSAPWRSSLFRINEPRQLPCAGRRPRRRASPIRG